MMHRSDQHSFTQSTFAASAMVTSPHSLASEEGLKILKQGGNAVDAAITIAAMLSVSYPHFNGLGGDAFMLLSNAKGEVTSISGIGQAFEVLPNFNKTIPTRGIHSAITTACTLDTWAKAHDFASKNWGTELAWGTLLQAAIDAAREGIVLSASQQHWYQQRMHDMHDWHGFKAIFSQQGQALAAGSIFKQPQLAQTLEHLAQFGARSFYEGELAERIVTGLQQYGSTISLNDLSRTHARIEPALTLAYRNGILCTLQPPTQGVTTLEIMGILQQFELAKYAREGSADYYHLLIEAIKQAFLDRKAFVADPDFIDTQFHQLLDADYLEQKSQQISLSQALPWQEIYQHGDTVYIGVVDQHGNCVSMLQTIYYDWGSGVIAGDTGILWHNRGASFSLDRNHPNCVQAFKRPFHTLNPGIYLKNQRPYLLYGTQGADGQPQTLATILTRLIDYGDLPFEALKKPRFLLGKTFSNQNNTLKIEQDVGQHVINQLTKMEHQIDVIAAQNPLSGQPGVIQINADGIYAAHDPRSDGQAIGF